MFSGYTGISLSVCLSLCASVYKILVSVKALAGSIKSHSVAALVSANFNFLSANALNLDQCRILSFGKELSSLLEHGSYVFLRRLCDCFNPLQHNPEFRKL